jgi:hypothetical protein
MWGAGARTRLGPENDSFPGMNQNFETPQG